MSDNEFKGRRRSTRAPRSQKEDSTPDVQPKRKTQEGGARSRLSDGARSRPGSSGSSNPASTPQKSGAKSEGSPRAKGDQLPNLARNGNANRGTDKRGPSEEAPSQKDAQEGKKRDGKEDAPEGAQAGGKGKKMKKPGADATGVDYSDKGTKDQLEHQAADVAMDATPVLSQFNSARKALKKHNKAKKDAGGEGDGLTDKAEEVMDKGVDAGIKGVKLAAGAGLAGGAGYAGMMALMMMKMLMMLKGMALAVVGKVAGFFGSIFSGMSSFVSGVLGVTTAIGNTIAAGISALVIAGTSVLGVGVVQEVTKKDDSAACAPIETRVSERSQSYIGSGEMEAVRKDHAEKLWSVYSTLGSSKEQTAAVLGNLQAESSLDPTAVETIYSEPFVIGSIKQSAIAADFRVELIDASYAARFPAINYVGIGLAQWTNGRNRLLLDYANDNDVNWFEFDTQIRFMLDGDDELRQEQLLDFLNAEPGNVQSETERFMNTWIGLSSPNPSLSDRQTNATDYMFILERATADTDYANSILSGINVNRSYGNNAAGAYYQDDGCGKPIKSHYGNQAADGTGEVPSDLTLVPWSRETLPESLTQYAKNPEDAGLAWGSASGWANGIIPDQCAALSHSYFMRLYPAWNQNGRPTTRAYGDGKDVAANWASHYGESVVNYPSAGAVFSDPTTSVYGHTGIVQHVFANGDILINEQNIRGVSGEGAGLNYSWSWRVIKKDRYEQAHWEFFKPTEAEPQWTTLVD
jgi:hypothetical protein